MRDLIHNASTDYVAFAITGALVLIVSLIYVWWMEQSSGKLSCPGLKPKDKILGNLGEITKDGGLHQFLFDNHKKHGQIFSFFWGKDLAVSIASPATFKDVVTLFDRSVGQFEMFKPLIGKYSIQYINLPEGRKHRQVLDRHFSFAAIKSYFHIFVDISKELQSKWNSINKDEHIPLTQHMLAIAMKSVVKTSFGEDYFKTNKEILELQDAYHTCWDDMEHRLDGNLPEPNSERQKSFDKSIGFIKNKVRQIINHRRALKESTHNFLDVLLGDDLYSDDEQIIDMVVTYLVGGFHTTGYLLTWAIYYLCLHPEIVQSIKEELRDELGSEEITLEHCEKLKYLKQVINETLRCSILAPFATRCSDFDIVVGGHIIPKKTPIILSMGSVLHDDVIWPEPRKFDPDRFSPENAKSRDPSSFLPFGFAGKRKCPGYRFAYCEAIVFLAGIFRNFNVKLIEGQKVSACYRLVTAPKEEIWISVESNSSK